MPGFDYFLGPTGASTQLTYQQNIVQEPRWDILIRGGQIAIGCEKHTFIEWWNFVDEDISAMHMNALAWWKQVKKPLFDLLEALERWAPPEVKKWEDDWM
jgi:hypothetical protein